LETSSIDGLILKLQTLAEVKGLMPLIFLTSVDMVALYSLAESRSVSGVNVAVLVDGS
jgi:hypothetical protein